MYASDLFSALFCYQFMLAQSLKFVPVFVALELLPALAF